MALDCRSGAPRLTCNAHDGASASPQVLLGWLLEPDAPEEALLLPGLYTAHLTAAPAAAPAAESAVASAVVSAEQRPTVSSSLSRVAAAAVCAAATGELLSTEVELAAIFALSAVLSACMQTLTSAPLLPHRWSSRRSSHCRRSSQLV